MRAPALAAAVICLAGALSAVGQQVPPPPKLSEVRYEEALAGRTVQLVLVEDWIKIENTAGLVRSAEFERYCPVSDDEQVVLGRWVSARTQGGTDLPADFSGAREDAAGNILQRVRIRPMPPGQRATVTLTTLVARRERPAPAGPFPIPKPEEYPEAVRPYLAGSPMVAVDDPYVRKVAADLLAEKNDALAAGAAVAKMAKARTYLPSGQGAEAQSLAASVLQTGGSCCASAVAAAAVLRACGIPAQVTYCPAGYVHGIVRFWLHGYGWVRMDATSGTGNLPLLQGPDGLGLVRLFDTPMKMEAIPFAYAWPYEHNDDEGELQFLVDGVKGRQVRMANTGGEALPWEQEPVPHLEPGSWNTVLGSEPLDAFRDWAALVKASKEAAKAGTVGAFKGVVEKTGAGKYIDVAEGWGAAK